MLFLLYFFARPFLFWRINTLTLVSLYAFRKIGVTSVYCNASLCSQIGGIMLMLPVYRTLLSEYF